VGSVSADPFREQRATVATACRILARHGLVSGVLGHVSVRAGEDRLLVRCRGPRERGLARTEPDDIRLLDLAGCPAEDMSGWDPPKELPIHTRLLATRPEVGAVVHAHPWAALLCGLAELEPRPVVGAYNIPALGLAVEGVGVYPRPVLIARDDLADEMVAAMGAHRACLLRGHGVTVVGASVAQATVTALDLEELCRITLELARIDVRPAEVTSADRADLPDLGGAFNDELRWRALVADLDDRQR
jgi:ribulose-5-phosphate 4-epimerase/fuculose-1-phosphate aldolase